MLEIKSQMRTGCAPVISITTTLAVTGDCVQPAKNATIHKITKNVDQSYRHLDPKALRQCLRLLSVMG